MRKGWGSFEVLHVFHFLFEVIDEQHWILFLFSCHVFEDEGEVDSKTIEFLAVLSVVNGGSSLNSADPSPVMIRLPRVLIR